MTPQPAHRLTPDQESSPTTQPVPFRHKFHCKTVEQFMDRYGVDVSRGGICIRSQKPLAVGTLVKLELVLEDGTPLIVGEGRVLWQREKETAGADAPAGMGVRFGKLTPASQQLINNTLAQRAKRELSGPMRRPSGVYDMTAVPPNDGEMSLANSGPEEVTPAVQITPPPEAQAWNSTRASGSSPVLVRNELSMVSPLPGRPSAGVLPKPKTGATPAPGLSSVPAPSSVPVLAIVPPSSALLAGGAKAAPAIAQAPVPVAAPAAAAAKPAPSPKTGLLTPRNKMVGAGIAFLLLVVGGISAMRGGSSKSTSASKPVASVSAGATARPVAPVAKPAPEAPAEVAHVAPAPTPIADPTPAPEVAPTAANDVADEPASATTSDRRTADHGKASSASKRANPRRDTRQPEKVAMRDSSSSAGRTAATGRRGGDEGGAAEAAPAPTPAPRAEAPTVASAPEPVARKAPTASATESAAAASARTAAAAATAPGRLDAGGASHRLRLTSIPSEAEVLLDGQVIGKTPMFGTEIDISRSHVLIVRKEGFQPVQRTITATSEWTTKAGDKSVSTLRIATLLNKI